MYIFDKNEALNHETHFAIIFSVTIFGYVLTTKCIIKIFSATHTGHLPWINVP
jgi:hypothetical protein